MALASLTTRGGFADFLPYFFDAKLGTNLFANLLLYNFGERRPVPANFGDTIRIPRPKKTFIVGAAPAEGTLLSPSSLSGESISGQLKKFAGAYAVSDLVVLTAFSDVVNIHVEMLGRDIARAMDDHIQNSLSANTGQYTIGPSPGFLSQNIKTANVLGVNQILRAVNLLEEADNPRPAMGFFPLIIRPAAAYDLQARISGNAWVQINQGATDTALQHLYKAALGDLYGARIFKSTRMKRYLGSGLSAGVSGYRSLLLGPQSFFVTEISEAAAQVIVKPLGSGGTYDPDNSLGTIAAKVFFTALPANWGSEKRMARLLHGGQLK